MSLSRLRRWHSGDTARIICPLSQTNSKLVSLFVFFASYMPTQKMDLILFAAVRRALRGDCVRRELPVRENTRLGLRLQAN